MNLKTKHTRDGATENPKEPQKPKVEQLSACQNDSELLQKFNSGMGDVAFIFRLDIEDYHHWEHHFHLGDFRMFLRPNTTDWKILNVQLLRNGSSGGYQGYQYKLNVKEQYFDMIVRVTMQFAKNTQDTIFVVSIENYKMISPISEKSEVTMENIHGSTTKLSE